MESGMTRDMRGIDGGGGGDVNACVQTCCIYHHRVMPYGIFMRYFCVFAKSIIFISLLIRANNVFLQRHRMQQSYRCGCSTEGCIIPGNANFVFNCSAFCVIIEGILPHV